MEFEQTSNRYVLTHEIIDYDQLAKDLVIYLRDDLTQRDLSLHLGYSFNQVGKWESGHTRVRWSNFCDLLEFRGIEVKKVIDRIVEYVASDLDYRDDILEIIIKGYTLLEKKGEDSYEKIKRISQTTSKQIDLATILELLDCSEHILIYQLSDLIDCSQIRLLENKYQIYQDRIDAIAENPMIPAVRASLELSSYKELKEHSDQFVAIHSGASLVEVKHALSIMLGHREIEKKARIYKVIGPGYSFSHSRNPRLRNFNKTMFDLAGRTYPVDLNDCDRTYAKTVSNSSILVNPVSQKVSQELATLIRDVHSKVYDILAKDQTEYKDEPKENVQVITLGTFTPAILNSRRKDDLRL